MRKSERQQLIETLIRRKALSTQGELVAALEKLGCQVTQATVSRDMRELLLERFRAGPGHLVELVHVLGLLVGHHGEALFEGVAVDRRGPREQLQAIVAHLAHGFAGFHAGPHR